MEGCILINKREGRLDGIRDREGADLIGRDFYGEGNFTVVNAGEWRVRVKAVGFETAMREAVTVQPEVTGDARSVRR